MGDETVRRLYLLVLRREPDADALDRATHGLADGTLTESGLLVELVSSSEFTRLRALEDGIAFARRARAAGDPRPHWLTAPAGTDERAVEVPWVLSRLHGASRLLDLGSANADALYLAALVEAAPGAIGLDLAPAEIPGLRTEVGDLRALPFPDRSFDVLLCVSTLEHVGSSQEPYGIEADAAAGGIPEALREIRRVLARRGYALVTVPCGAEQDHGWFVQHDRETWNRLFAEADMYVADQELYVLGPEGWRAGDDDTAAYGERGSAASAVLCSELHPGRARHRLTNRAAAAFHWA